MSNSTKNKGIEEAFDRIFEAMSEGIVVVSANGSIDHANPVAEKMFGYAPGSMAKLPLSVLIPEKIRVKHETLRKEFQKKPEPRQMGAGRDLTAQKKDGSLFPVEIGLSYFENQGQKMVIAFVTDITKRKETELALKQSEEQLIEYAGELEKRVSERTQELNQSIANLEKEISERKKAEEEANRALEREREFSELKSKFVTIASHEFKTPLSTILSSTALIEQYVIKGDLEKLDKHTKRIRSSVNHLTVVLNDLLSLGKLEEGKVTTQIIPVPLSSFLEDTAEKLEGSLKKGQYIKLNCQQTQLELYTDEKILRNIIFNLISNASKYSEPDKPIQLTCKISSDQCVFTVRDEGVGIPEEDQKHLFSRFFRATNVAHIPGTGLGLNIVRKYVELLHGSISFESKENAGSTFHVKLPIT